MMSYDLQKKISHSSPSGSKCGFIMSIVDIIDCAAIPYNQNNSMVSCQKGPTHHAYAWQIGPFWQDTLELRDIWQRKKKYSH